MKGIIKELHPRPQFFREGAVCLNGSWEFAFDNEKIGEEKNWFVKFPKEHDIIVPFTYETAASGIGKTEPCNSVWYKRAFELNSISDKRTLLHFEGSDYITKVWINGSYAGENRGAYHRFSFDITPHLKKGANIIVVKCEDSLDACQPRGKQRWYNGKEWGCFYVQTTGIWKDVWMEQVDSANLNNVKITPNIDNYNVRFDVELSNATIGCELETVILLDNKRVFGIKCSVERTCFSYCVDITSTADNWFVAEWTPDNPRLYDVNFVLYKGGKRVDETESYFGFREFRADRNRLLLNRVPVYQKLILNQGYWAQSGMTAPEPQAFKEDLEFVKRMGFNGVRMHQKIEDERFLYQADKMGLIVWCEMPSPYEFADNTIADLIEQWQKIVKQNYNHPSVCVWVPFNESWGVQRIYNDKAQQNFTQAAYFLTKAYDTMRPVISNDGWEHTQSDILTLHNYEESGTKLSEQYEHLLTKTVANANPTHSQKQAYASGFKYAGQPIIVSEYGGIAFQADKESGWGYGNLAIDEESFLTRMESVTNAIKSMPDVCGYCYTQLTDVEQEVNGLLTSNRTPKVPLEKIKQINDKK